MDNSPPNDFMGIQVCYKREIAHTFIGFNIGDVTCPNLVWMGRNDSLNQVWVFAIIMVGICCLIAPTALYTYHESMLTQHLNKCVTTREAACILKHLFQYGMQLYSS